MLESHCQSNFGYFSINKMREDRLYLNTHEGLNQGTHFFIHDRVASSISGAEMKLMVQAPRSPMMKAWCLENIYEIRSRKVTLR